MKNKLYELKADDILYSDATPEEKVYLCFQKCHDKIPYYLKYAILEWKDKHLKELGRCFPINNEEDF